jgi:hypothetical protein
VKWTKLSCRRFKDNAAPLQLFALAYNLANFLRQLVLPKPIQGWTLTTLREKLVKDRGEGGVARQVSGLPTGGGSDAPQAIRGHRRANQPAAAAVCFGVRLAVMDKNGSQVVAVRSGCAVRDKFGGWAREKHLLRWVEATTEGVVASFFVRKPLQWHVRGGLGSIVGAGAEAQERAIWGRSA